MKNLVRSALGAVAAIGMSAAPLAAQAFINNGTVMLGVNRLGHLNLNGGPISGQGTTTTVGLRHFGTQYESTADGCECEGWGVGVRGGPSAGLTGYANDALGTAGLVSTSFASGGNWATSVVTIGGKLKVTHDYKPSISANLYLVDVTIENISGADIGAAGNPNGVVYRRVMDWDIEPSAFSEHVTLKGGTARYNAISNPNGNLIGSGNDGFETSNVMSGSSCGALTIFYGCAVHNADFVDIGPNDHGAVFDFGFGELKAGKSITFKTFYGAAAGNPLQTPEQEMLAALGLVGAEAYSLGQCNTAACKSLGTPVTFAFGFKGIGGTSIEPSPVPEPATVGLFATGLIGLGAALRRRRNAK
jgi:hypothetical protein